MKLRLILTAIALAAATSACYELATAPSPADSDPPHGTSDGSGVPPDTTSRGGTSMGNGN